MNTLKDVALRAGVSTGSVSKVLNGSPGVSEKLKRKVQRAIEELNYRPNMVARSLRTKTTNTVAVMVPTSNDPYFVEFFRGVSLALRDINCVPMLYSMEFNTEMPINVIQEVLMRGVDGLIVSTYGWKQDIIDELFRLAERIPVVSFKRNFPGTAIHSVNIDDESGMYMGVKHLIDIGHKRIGYLAAGLELKTGQDRMKGFLTALEEAGIPYDDNLVVNCESFQIEAGYNRIQQLLKRFPRPTAIVGANDSLAIGAMKYLESRKVRIPEEIAVMGYDDEPLSTLVTPKLSSVSVPVYEMTRRAVQIIDLVLRGELKEQINDVFPTEIAVRESTDFSAHAEFEFGRFSK
ncbi:LacI family DNA-binding transcriptional regulator [Cohnella nanjingensis]|uniref:LacI family DNA-binding transcriptional regulator n=1 Tax=Cohnella nanjingensis TaxID=1387779 RepID=A0A7X0RPH2_9BACL|nr:LacI family DNA-binding transcriptional regulator [Cohnella nanjingensis]MBB6671264.1 LacI family DNA-binding transcriptional regulator [Cohnella nanjingensis]